MEIKECATCGARWINGEFFWATGKPGSELDLAGLVCNRFAGDRPCLNSFRGQDGGDTWEKRFETLGNL